MSAEANVPDNTATDWQSIDIFVFSNGQQYSPPRKYHLRNEELNWWKTTLNYLAKSQYGSLHSMIDLYTVDGHKVEGPLELSNGHAYVAVKPPDQFLDTGYDKYLMKASRSWEKRQASKINSNELAVPESIHILAKRSKSDININISDTKTPHNTNTIETIFHENLVDDQASVLVGPHIQSATKPNIPSETIKPVDKRKPYAIQRNSILKRNSTPITPPTVRKPFLKAQDSSPKRATKVPLKANEKTPSASSNNNKIVVNPRLPPKLRNNVKETVPKPSTVPSKIEEVSAEIATSSVTKVIHRSSVSEDTQVDNLIDDKNAKEVSNIFQNRQSQIPSFKMDTVANHDVFQHLQNSIPIDVTEVPPLNRLGATRNAILGSIKELNRALPSVSSPKINNQIKIVNTCKLPNDTKIPDKSENDFVTLINKGDAITLKLQIEITNGDGVSAKPLKIKNRSIPYTNVKSENGSQINIDDAMITQSKSLQSILAKEFTHTVDNEEKLKIIVIKCACCYHYDDNVPTSDKENKRYVILLPTTKHDENARRCHCEPDDAAVKEDIKGQDDTKKLSIDNPLKKTYSVISMETFIKTNIETVTAMKNEPEMALSDVNSNISQRQELKINEYVVALPINENLNPNCLIEKRNPSPILNENKKTEYNVIEPNEVNPPVKNLIDKFTQTDWCSILLEARLQQDGHYTLHLPPLHVLRHYKL